MKYGTAVKGIAHDKFGRWSDCVIFGEGYSWKVRVVYAPSNKKERLEWMEMKLDEGPLDEIDILVGDFNCVLEKNQIKNGGKNSASYAGAGFLIEMVEKYNL